MGGSPSMPAQPTPAEEADARIREMQAQAELDAKTAADKAAADAAQHTKDVQATQDRVAQAYSAAQGYGRTQLQAKGIDPMNDPYGIMGLYNNSLDLARQSIPEVTTNPGTYFGPSLYDTAYSTARENQRRNLGRQMDAFAGTGFERQAFGDTSDDAILNSILGQQQTDAKAALDAAKARGQINDYGYSGAQTDLLNQFKAGLSKANDIGAGVLSGYQKQLTDRAAADRAQIQNYDFGDNISPDAFKTDLSSLQTSLGGRMEGDILNAIGGTNFFDTSKLLATAGTRSGLVNPAAPNTVGAIDPNQQQKSTTGTTGAF